ncbi:MAG TPA: 50S ribosomal protein L29 [Acholeplasmataceae bacterium]|nr:50S ribosomal protein L29 [Acholeplasmataceae bacterium]
MKANDIRKLDNSELENRISELKAELFNLRFQLAVGQLENTARIKTVKRTIAQMKTVITQRANGINE